MKKVVIFQYRLFHYRIDLFEKLKAKAETIGLDLNLVVGQPSKRELAKNDVGEISWARKVRNFYIPIAEKKDLCWQPCPKDLRSADLVIFMQENRLLSNYYWIIRRRFFGGPKVAFWGHGRDFQTRSEGGFRERWKKASICWVDWWFAYTDLTRRLLLSAGFPGGRIACLNNAIDVGRLQQEGRDCSPEYIERLLKANDISADGDIAIMCGSLYSDKKLPFLIRCADVIHDSLPSFQLIVIGDGPDREELVREIDGRPWIKWVGVRRGIEKAAYFKSAKLVLNPGLVGLHILDGFAMGLPMITTKTAQHSPEIEYLLEGRNGLMCEEDVSMYSASVVALLRDQAKLDRMRRSALESAALYSVDAMVDNFISGIVRAVGLTSDARSNNG